MQRGSLLSNTLKTHCKMPHQKHPSHILVAGGGPSALFLSLSLLQQTTEARITILESQTTYADIPKAYAFLPLLFPDFKATGIYDELAAAGASKADTGINFRLSADKDKRVISKMPTPPGAPGPLLLSQKMWLEIVKARVAAYERAEVRMGVEVVSVDDLHSEGVQVTVRTENGATETYRGDYLVGADGSHSTVRKQCGISFDGETLPQQLVATDVYYPFEKHGWGGANFMVDEKYYGMCGPINDEGLWRVSFGIDGSVGGEVEETKPTLNGTNGQANGTEARASGKDSTAELDRIHASIPEWFDNIFPGPRPLEYKIDKVAGYRAQQRCASTFRKGPILLIGDAAHITNPYIGMGLATGLLDAAALAPVLAAVVEERCGDANTLLDAWADARRKVFKNMIDPLSRAAFASVQDSTVETFEERHPLVQKAMSALREGKKPSPPPVKTEAQSLAGW